VQSRNSGSPRFLGDLWQRMREMVGVTRDEEIPAAPLVKPPKAKFQRAIVVPVCPACRKALRPGPYIPCTNEQPHLTHARCASLMHGKCATCGFFSARLRECGRVTSQFERNLHVRLYC